MSWQNKTSPRPLIGQDASRRTCGVLKKHTRKEIFALKPLVKKHKYSDTRNATLAIRVLTYLIQRLKQRIQLLELKEGTRSKLGGREIEGKGVGGSKQTPAKNLDAPVTKGELGNEIKRVMLEHLPTILAQSRENLRKAEESRKAVEEAEKKKKVNEEAERRRKAIEDKRAAEEQKRKRKAEQDRKNAEEAERLRIEEVERQEMQKPRETDYASHLLKGEARHWWDMIKIARSDDVASVMTWEEFEDLGLRARIRGLFQQARPATFQEAVELALIVEKENNRQLEEGGDNKRKRENREDNVKKIKTNSGKMENVGEYKPCNICKKTHNGECWHDNCRNCGKSGHTSKECKAKWVCFKCKIPGHKIVDCLKRKPHDIQSQKTMGKVFQLTTKNA
ncbi:zinc finger, CCHC-type, retrotransposon gag domain protein [Tanacetum coccineum]